MKLNNVSLITNGRLSEGTVAFHGCVTYINEHLSPPCEPFDQSTGSKGLILTRKLKGLLSLHEGELLTIIEPASGTELATIFMGEECSIGEEFPVTGKLTLLDSEISVEKTTHLIKEGPLTSLKALVNPAAIDGTALVRLTSGGKFSGFML